MHITEFISGKVKPEFGNLDHIKAIKQAEIEAEESKKIKKYKVRVEWTGEEEVEVEAHDEDEAKEIANDMVDFDDVYDVQMSVKKI